MFVSIVAVAVVGIVIVVTVAVIVTVVVFALESIRGMFLFGHPRAPDP